MVSLIYPRLEPCFWPNSASSTHRDFLRQGYSGMCCSFYIDNPGTLRRIYQLRDIWSSEIAKDPTTTITSTRIDVVPWLTKVTLDIIGLTGKIAPQSNTHADEEQDSTTTLKPSSRVDYRMNWRKHSQPCSQRVREPPYWMFCRK